ncbi:uncharacterized protein LOC129748229 [Uranotaenia lowii]|uniref:uncharacterized protein LOC129748229 n=1 Tax=Uranotaenia lowii TaxID=190385 RepID=UPI00247A1305|nr:uncharacterized protein LOC129748229 [Uranotaenia lowii]
MDLNFKCPLCDTYFDTKDELSEHIKAVHTSYYYDTYLIPPMLIMPDPTPLYIASESAPIVTQPPVAVEDVTIEPVVPTDDGCCECDNACDSCCCGCCDGGGGDTIGDSGGDCGDCGDCGCDCVLM